MSFPTIPTSAAGRILANVQANTTATRTGPALSGLTKNSGDLLIFIVVAYQLGSTGTTDQCFSGWTGGFAEFHDSGTTSTMAIGAAYKWSDGTETAAPAVTQAAGTITGHAAMIVMSIPGAHASTPPEAGGRTSVAGASSNAVADAGVLDPAGWATEDTLWIAVCGAGETATTGTWTGVTGAPANYTSYFDSGMSADAIGGVEVGVAFRQAAAASEDPGAFSADGSYSRSGAIVIAVRPVPVQNYTDSKTDTAGATDTAPAKARGTARTDTAGAVDSISIGGTAYVPPVVIDAIAPGSTGQYAYQPGSAGTSWSHTCAEGAVLLVGVAIGDNPDTADTTTASYNDVPMEPLGTAHAGGSTAGYCDLFYLADPTPGAHTVAVGTGAESVVSICAGSISLLNAHSIGDPVVGHSPGLATGISVDVPGTDPNGLVVDVACEGTNSAVNSGKTSRWWRGGNNDTAAGNGGMSTSVSADGTVTMSYTGPNEWWGIVAVEVRTASAQSYTDSKTDTAGAVDAAPTQARGTARADTAGAVDAAPAKILGRSRADGAGAGDSAAREFGYGRAAADGAGATDAHTTARKRTSEWSTAVPGRTAVPAQNYEKTAADAAGATDASTKALGRIRADGAGATDATALARTKTAADTAGVTDTVQVALGRTAADGAGATDTSSRILSAVRAPTDTAGAVDTAPSKARTTTAADTAGAADTSSRILAIGRTAADTAGAVDAHSESVAGSWEKTEHDYAAAADATSRAITAWRTAADAAGAVDAHTEILSGDVTKTAGPDAAGAVDAVRVSLGRAATDSAGAADSRTLAHGLARTDTAGAADTSAKARSTARTDTAGAADTSSRILAVGRTAADTAGATDAFSVSSGGIQSAHDYAGATDAVSYSLTMRRTATDTAGAGDSSSRVAEWRRAAADTAGALDVASRVAEYLRVAADALGAVDIFETEKMFGRDITVHWSNPRSRELAPTVTGRQLDGTVTRRKLGTHVTPRHLAGTIRTRELDGDGRKE